MVFQNKSVFLKSLRGTGGGGPIESHREYYVEEGFSGNPPELRPEFPRTARGRYEPTNSVSLLKIIFFNTF